MKTSVSASAERRRSTLPVPQDVQAGREVESATDSSHVNHGLASRMDRIAERAHEIYQSRGGGDGRALEDWLQAEREIDTEG